MKYEISFQKLYFYKYTCDKYIICSEGSFNDEILLEGFFTLYPQKKTATVQLTNSCIEIKNSNVSTCIISLKDVVGKFAYKNIYSGFFSKVLLNWKRNKCYLNGFQL